MRYIGAIVVGFAAALVTTIAWETIRIMLVIFGGDSMAATGAGGMGTVSIGFHDLRTPLLVGFVLGFVGFMLALRRRRPPDGQARSILPSPPRSR